MARRTAKAAEALREQIVDEALRQFANMDVDATSIGSIAKAIGISRQALMHHFPSKQALQHAIQDRLAGSMDHFLPRFVAAFTAEDSVLDAMLSDLLDALEAHRDFARFLVRRWILQPADEVPPAATAIRALLIDYLRRGQASGALRPDFVPEDALFAIGSMFLITHASWDHRGGDTSGLPMAELRMRRHRELIRIARAALLPPKADRATGRS